MGEVNVASTVAGPDTGAGAVRSAAVAAASTTASSDTCPAMRVVTIDDLGVFSLACLGSLF